MKIALALDTLQKSYDYIATFSNVAGIEGEFIIQKHEDGELDICEITLFNCNISEEAFINKFNTESKLHGNTGYIFILSSDDKIVSGNFISDIQITTIFTDDSGKLNIKINGWLHTSSKGFYQIIKKRLTQGLQEYGEWKKLPAENVQGWLEDVAKSRTLTDDISNKVVTIHSDDLDEEDKFYCALGEIVNGIGGYFGRCPNSLSDCLHGDFGIKGNFTLNWIDHKKYKEKFPVHFNYIVETFADNKKTLKLL